MHAEQSENVLMGTCVFCYTSVLRNQARFENRHGLYHVICFAEERADKARSCLEAITKERDAYRAAWDRQVGRSGELLRERDEARADAEAAVESRHYWSG